MRLSPREYRVFTRKSEAERVTLLMTRRPSATTRGREAKSASSRVSCAACFAASEPPAMAMEQSAVLRAGMSFTPSPVMATEWPFSCRRVTSRRLRSGVTRPKTTVSSQAARSSSSVARETSSAFPVPATPARFASAATVRGSSPLISFTVTSCPAK